MGWATPALAFPPVTAGVNPVADAFVSSANPANNYGGGGSLAVSAGGLPNGEFVSVMRFDVSSAKAAFDAAFGPGQWSVDSVGLRLTAALPNNPIFNASAAGQFAATWMEDDSWVEGSGTPVAPGAVGITFNSLPSFVGPNDVGLGSFAYDGSTSGSTTYALGLPVNFANDLLAGGLVSMRLSASDSVVSYLFNSRNNAMVANRPEMIITAIPEPAAAALLVFAVGLVARRRWLRN